MARVIISLHEDLRSIWKGCEPAAALSQEIDLAAHHFDICRLFNEGRAAEVILPAPLTVETANQRYQGIFRFNRKR
jgi:hypothetical protein